MSSVASKHALLFALGGFSIAALFVWYIKKKDNDEREKKKAVNGTHKVQENGIPKKVTTQNGHANGGVVQNSKKTNETNSVAAVQNEKPSIEVENKEEEEEEVPTSKEQEETDHVAAGDANRSDLVVEEQPEEKEDEGEEEEEEVEEEETETVVLPSEVQIEEAEKEEEEQKAEEVEEEIVKKVEPKLKSAPAPITMPSKSKVLDQDQIPEEPTPTKNEDSCLKVDVTQLLQASPISWSEEMEKEPILEATKYEFNDSDKPLASPLRHNSSNSHQKKGQKTPIGRGGKPSGRASAGKEHHRPQQFQKEEKHTPLKKGQRRLTKEKSVEETPEKPQKRVVLKKPEATPVSTDVSFNQTIEIHHPDEDGYEKSGSPGLDSQNSEASSQDSGRATGPLASPHDADGFTGTDDDFTPMYEFEIPNSLVGLIIGVKGKTIKELSQRTNVRMLIRQHHAPEKSKTHQICQVRGKRDEINHCLQMLRRRFPPARFPELNLQPVVPPVLPNSNFDMLSTQPTWLSLPDEIKSEVAVSSIISPSHFFIQQPTHPSFASLRHLDMYMGTLYGEQSNLPELPIPCQNGLLCAAPVNTSWFRAVTVQYFEETDEVFVKFVDYGGYSKMARQDLRQIRTDLMSLPFQSTEVMLAHVRPADLTTNWSEEAMQKFRETCIGKVINCKVVGYSVDTRIPMVELYMPVKDGSNTREVRFDKVLMETGLARPADPSKMSRTTYSTSLTNGISNGSGDVNLKRPSFSTQTSQAATAVC